VTRIIRLNPTIAKRLEREGGSQPRHGRCVICGGPWEDCPHTRAQTNALEQTLRLSKVMPR
jgi:hypothetical protein